MEISLKMANGGQCKVNIADECAKDIYGQLAILLHEAYLKDGIEAPLRSVPECVEKSMDKQSVGTTDSIVSPSRDWAKSRIVFYTCPECENLRYAFVPESLLLQTFEARCSCGCAITLQDMEEVSYECPCCDFKGSVHVANGGTEVRCKDCKAIVDLPRPK